MAAIIPLFVMIVKLNLILTGSNSTVACLLLPFIIRLSVVTYQRVHHTYSDFINTSHLFFFQVGRIFAREDQALLTPNPNGGDNRWQAAVRLVFRRLREITISSSSGANVHVEESLHELSMLTL